MLLTASGSKRATSVSPVPLGLPDTTVAVHCNKSAVIFWVLSVISGDGVMAAPTSSKTSLTHNSKSLILDDWDVNYVKAAEQCCATVTLSWTGLDTVFSTVWRGHLGLTEAIYSSSGVVFQKKCNVYYLSTIRFFFSSSSSCIYQSKSILTFNNISSDGTGQWKPGWERIMDAVISPLFCLFTREKQALNSKTVSSF